MKNLYILGAGGFGREIVLLLQDIQNVLGQQWNVIGFLDDTENPLNGKACELRVVGTIQDFLPQKNDTVAIAVADPIGKQKIVSLLKPRGAKFEKIIHPNVGLGQHNTFGEGVVICGGCGLTVNVSVGNFCTLQHCTLGHDVTVGDFSTISSFVNVMGGAKIGRNCFIGGNAAIAPHAVIGDGAFVGVGSVVLKRVKAGEKVFGNPAREIGV